MARRPRIVSLLPSATEIVCALGLRERLVGRSHECDFPESVASLPVCTTVHFETDGSSREIDERVRSVVRHGLSPYEVNESILARLHPTHIVSQTQCEVCAITSTEVENAVASLGGEKVEIVSLKATSIEGMFDDIRRVAEALGSRSDGSILVGGLRSRLSTIKERSELTTMRPTVLCVEWLDPLMAAGHWIPELVDVAGGVALLSKAGQHARKIDWAEVVAAEPETIVLMPCGFDIHRTRREIASLATHRTWQEMKAVRENRVFLTDANQYFSRPGPRLIDSLEVLAEILHPEAFVFGHEGGAWQRLKETR